jgi:single-stranded-DNA-specific exonuclease
MLFAHAEPLPARVRAVYRIGVNEFNARRSLQITFEHWQPA